MKTFKVLLMLLSAASVLAAGDMQVIEAMNTEIARAVKDLKIEAMEKPYFISLRLLDGVGMSSSAAFGKIFQETLDPKGNHFRFAQATARVGTPGMDNTNFRGGNFWMDFSEMPALPLTDEGEVLREAFWLAIDRAYKTGLSNLAEKKGYLDKHPQEEYPPDFLPAPEKSVFMGEAPPALKSEGMTSFVKTLTGEFRKYDFLSEGTANLSYARLKQYYSDSEGHYHVRPAALLILTVSLSAYTQDWYPIGRSRQWIFASPEKLPDPAEIRKAMEEEVRILNTMRTEKPLEEYTGPVLFEGEGAGRFFLDILGKGVSNPREILASERAAYYIQMMAAKQGFLGKRFGSRILPDGFQAADRPSERAALGTVLAGYLPVDDEGMKGRDVILVEKGRLVGLPMARTATKKFREVNGHATGSIFESPVSTITSLFIEDAKALDAVGFREKARALAADAGLEEVLVVRGFNAASRDGIVYRMREPSLLDPPALMALLNVRTGLERPVWGLEFRDVTSDILQKIAASRTGPGVYQFQQIQRGPGDHPVSVIAPDILVEEMSLQKAKLEKLRPPLTPMPVLN